MSWSLYLNFEVVIVLEFSYPKNVGSAFFFFTSPFRLINLSETFQPLLYI